MKDKKNPFIKLLTYLFLIGAAIILYSHFFGTKGLEIREYAITNSNIPSSYDGFKIVHFSDLHYGTTIKDNEMKNLISKINELKPDLVVFTGDLIDRNYQINDENIEKLASELNEIEASLGKYIITGNHDKNPGYSKVLEKIDYTFLDNKNEFIYYKGNTPIILVGLADNLEFDMKIDEAFNYENENGYYTILLLHEPDIIDMLKDKWDADLTGYVQDDDNRLLTSQQKQKLDSIGYDSESNQAIISTSQVTNLNQFVQENSYIRDVEAGVFSVDKTGKLELVSVPSDALTNYVSTPVFNSTVGDITKITGYETGHTLVDEINVIKASVIWQELTQS